MKSKVVCRVLQCTENTLWGSAYCNLDDTLLTEISYSATHAEHQSIMNEKGGRQSFSMNSEGKKVLIAFTPL